MREIPIVHILIEQEGTGLVVQHRDDFPGIWDPNKLCTVGGHVDPQDASSEVAALRELQEETGLSGVRLQYLGRIVSERAAPDGELATLDIEVYSAVVSSDQAIVVSEGRGAWNLPFNQLLPTDPEMVPELQKEIADYYPGKFPGV